MKAMVLAEPRPIEQNPLWLMEMPTPAVPPGHVLIRVRTCGVCHTDLHTVEGDLPLPKLPLIPGHQIVGVVENVGENAGLFRVGERVGVPWLHATCGRCSFCEHGRENLCDAAQFTGYHVDGGYAEFVVAPQDFVYRIPENFSDLEAAPLLCAGIIGYRALRMCEIQNGQKLGLYGFGASAHIAIQVALHWDCEVYVFSRTEEHLRLAKQLGAAWVGRAEDIPPAKLDSAIIFAPAGKLVPEALRVLNKGGTLALAGIYMTPIPKLDYGKMLYHERTIRSVANSTRDDARQLLQIAAEVPIRTEPERFALEDANRALRLLKASKIRGAGVLVV